MIPCSRRVRTHISIFKVLVSPVAKASPLLYYPEKEVFADARLRTDALSERFLGRLGEGRILRELIIPQLIFLLFSPVQPLDFETVAIHNIVVQAENPEPLVPGVQYNASSSATFRLTVTDVNEAPQFSQQVFEAKVSEAVAKGTQVGNTTAKDPEGLDVR